MTLQDRMAWQVEEWTAPVAEGKADKAAPVVLVKEARCSQCHRLLGRNVNAGAELWCQRCREIRIIPQPS